ncbi:MFS transporter [Dellaglioa algida]|uniref:MFS transporter n=1 Tax=Dellaglioa algida TaxID=105612 RepID=UPI0024C4E562|nr:MFS transporter [Dellaglioa algida]MDK1724742.1 MFS transporter [Dellaglioa algida]MDK1738718.1 MFS transporter [Dellaglioa algida]
MIQRKFKGQWIPVLIIFGVSMFLVLPQILNHSLILGADSLFHFNRIYDIYMQFKTGNFSYFQTNYGFQQGGRIVNALYGPGFAYVLGGLLVVVHSWIKFQVISSFLLFFISGYSMYLLSREMDSTKKISLFTAILFMGSFRISNWSTGQTFMTWGVMLMPLVVLMGVKMIKDRGKGLKIIPLALVVSIMIQVHLLSALMSIAVLIVFFVIGFLKTDQKINLLLKCLFAGLLSLILTFNVWGAMLDVFTTNTLYSPFANLNMSASTMNLSLGDSNLTQIGLVMSLIFVLQIVWLIFSKDKVSVTNRIVTAMGLVFLVISSSLIPWTNVGKNIPELQSFLQFPYRFDGFSLVLLLAGFGATISMLKVKETKKGFELLLIVGSIFTLTESYLDIQKNNEVWNTEHSVLYTRNVTIKKNISNEQVTKAFTGTNLNAGLKLVTKPTSDYLPNNRVLSQNPYGDYQKDMNKNKYKVTKKVNRNGDLIIRWKSEDKGKAISLPIVVYNNSSVQLNGTSLNPKKMTLSTMGSPTVISTKAGTNTLVLGYHSKIVTRTRLIIVLLAWLISGLLIVIHTYKKRKNNNEM